MWDRMFWKRKHVQKLWRVNKLSASEEQRERTSEDEVNEGAGEELDSEAPT